jgi:hypothetical protein
MSVFCFGIGITPVRMGCAKPVIMLANFEIVNPDWLRQEGCRNTVKRVGVKSVVLLFGKSMGT